MVMTSTPNAARSMNAIRNGEPITPKTTPTIQASLGSDARKPISSMNPRAKRPVSVR